MRTAIAKNNPLLGVPFVWFIGWAALVFLYIFSIKNGLFLKEWDYLVFFIQLACDIGIGVMGFLAYRLRLREDRIDKNFYLLFFISIIPGLFTNEIYNILINIIDITRTNDITFYWSGSYTAFLLVQFLAWGYLIRNKIIHYCGAVKNWLIIHPYIQQ